MRVSASKKSAFAEECLALWASALEAADTDRHAYNVERSSLHLRQIIPALGGRDKNVEAERAALCKKYGFPT